MMSLLSSRPALRALASVVCACLLLLAATAAAQTGFTPPGPPTASIAPDTGDKATASLEVIVTWRDTTLRAGLDPSTATVPVTTGSIPCSFVYQSVAQADAGDVEATSTGTISLTAGQTATVTARICNNLNNCS